MIGVILITPPLIGGFGSAFITKRVLVAANVKNRAVLVLAPIGMSLVGAFAGMMLINNWLNPGTSFLNIRIPTLTEKTVPHKPIPHKAR